jgi:hypothetical protein
MYETRELSGYVTVSRTSLFTGGAVVKGEINMYSMTNKMH